MSLQVWLPLNKEGNFLNQGLADITVTNNGATYDANGKIGKCVCVDSSKKIIFPSLSWMRPTNENSFSIAFWINISLFSWIIACAAFECSITSKSAMFRLGNGGSNTINCLYKALFDTNTWYHFAATWNKDTKEIKLYINGECKSTAISSLTSFNNISSTINIPYGGSYKFNDIRFYDSCLSPKEVHEIAKGLVLHYPMNDEYVDNTVYDCSGYCNNGTVTGSLQVVEDSPRYKKCSKFYNTTVGIKNLPTFTDNSISISFWMKPDTITNSLCILNYRDTIGSDLAVFLMSIGIIRFDAGGLTSFTSYQYSTEWQHVVLTYDGSYKRLYINGELLSSAALNSNITINATKGTIGLSSVNTIIGNATNVYRGKLSDFRIYSTALSEKDVKELYNTSAIINNNNTLEAYEFSESNTYSINKSGVLEGAEFIEQDGEVLINNTEQVFATEFIEI